MRRLLVLLTICLLILQAWGCHKPQPPLAPPLDFSDSIEPGIAEKGEDITDYGNTLSFMSKYNMDHLQGHQLYWDSSSKTLQIEFYFYQEVTRSQVDAARI